MKRNLLSLLLSLSLSCLFAQGSILDKMPLDIVPGITDLSDIQTHVTSDQLVLADKKMGTKQFVYQVANGKFMAAVSLDQTITQLIFDTKKNHVLPSNWQGLGLHFSKGKDCDVFGTGKKKLKSILDKNGAINIQDIDMDHMSFIIGDLFYEVEFRDVCGLSKISISEIY